MTSVIRRVHIKNQVNSLPSTRMASVCTFRRVSCKGNTNTPPKKQHGQSMCLEVCNIKCEKSYILKQEEHIMIRTVDKKRKGQWMRDHNQQGNNLLSEKSQVQQRIQSKQNHFIYFTITYPLRKFVKGFQRQVNRPYITLQICKQAHQVQKSQDQQLLPTS